MKQSKITQPANNSQITWSAAFKHVRQDQFEACQKYVDTAVLRYNAKYIPFQTGNLNMSGTTGTTVGSGKVVYNAPYARYMYYGKVMRDDNGRAFYGKAPKHVTDEELTYHGAPQRGKLWFERMKAAHKNAIIAGCQKYFK